MTTSDPTTAWLTDQQQSGRVVGVLGQTEDSAVTKIAGEDDDNYIILYDTEDGHMLRRPKADREYMLAKRRPVKPGERVRWFKSPNGRGMYQSAPGGTVPAYQEAPLLSDSQPGTVAPTGAAKTGRRRRGKRGSRKGKVN